MSVTEQSRFVAFLEGQDQKTWKETVDNLVPSIHPVDRTATRIWFAFWPLELVHALRGGAGPREMARIMDLEGRWRLEEQFDSSVSFLYGAKHWRHVKRAVVARGSESSMPDGTTLEQEIRDAARAVAASESVDPSLVLGITAVAFMVLQQVGLEMFAASADQPAAGPAYNQTPDAVVRRRERETGGGWLGFLKGVNRAYRITWDEKSGGSFDARNGEDIASAAARVDGDFRSVDYRRPQGPVPVECRVASCGYCWVGIVHGKENLSPLTDHERKRLQYFGYDTMNSADDVHPPIRLACQAQCRGDVTLVIPSWNGELKRRFDKTRDQLGTV